MPREKRNENQEEKPSYEENTGYPFSEKLPIMAIRQQVAITIGSLNEVHDGKSDISYWPPRKRQGKKTVDCSMKN